MRIPKNEEQGTNCKLIPSVNDHPIFCENEKTSALKYSGANPEDSSQTSLNFSALLSLSKGGELYPFVKTFAHCSGSAVKAKDPITVKLGFGCPAETSKWTESSVIFNTYVQKPCVPGMNLLGRRVKSGYTLFLPKKYHVVMRIG